MASKGQQLLNPKNGEYFEFIKTASETGGAFTTIKVLIKKGGFKPVMHKHLDQEETFEVISGQLTYILEGKAPVTLGPGEKVTLPRGVGHTHFNDTDSDLVMYQTASPSLDFEPFIKSLHHHIINGNMKNGQPPFLQLMIWMKEMEGTTCVANIPISVQKALATFLAPVGKLMGYKTFYS